MMHAAIQLLRHAIVLFSKEYYRQVSILLLLRYQHFKNFVPDDVLEQTLFNRR